MSDLFFERSVLNSPYEYPDRHWELDADGQPTQYIVETRQHRVHFANTDRRRDGTVELRGQDGSRIQQNSRTTRFPLRFNFSEQSGNLAKILNAQGNLLRTLAKKDQNLT